MQTGPIQSARQALIGELLRLDPETAPPFDRLIDDVDRSAADGTLAAVGRELVLSAEARDLFLAALEEGHELEASELLRELLGARAEDARDAKPTPAGPSMFEQRLAQLEARISRAAAIRRRIIIRGTDAVLALGLVAVGWISGRHLLRPLDVVAIGLVLLSLAGLRVALDGRTSGRLRAIVEMTAVAAACAAAVFFGAGLADAKLASTWIALSDVASVGSVACSLYTMSRMR